MMAERQKTWARPVVAFEIQAKDQEKMTAFYAEMFEWNITPGAVPGFQLIERGIGADPEGIGGLMSTSATSRIAVMIQVADLGDSVVHAEELGGRVVLQPFDVPNGPTVARIEDPEGNLLVLIQQ
jgi:predicted enzyme related to lactoylglutathione lyase